MSSRTSSRSTLTMVPETKSPSLKYLMVSSIAARKSSAEPMSLTATWGLDFCSGLEMVIKDGLRCGQLIVGGQEYNLTNLSPCSLASNTGADLRKASQPHIKVPPALAELC